MWQMNDTSPEESDSFEQKTLKQLMHCYSCSCEVKMNESLLVRLLVTPESYQRFVQTEQIVHELHITYKPSGASGFLKRSYPGKLQIAQLELELDDKRVSMIFMIKFTTMMMIHF